MSSFEGKVAVITEVGSGIGRALTLSLSEKRAKLAPFRCHLTGWPKPCARLKRSARRWSDRLDVAEREGSVAPTPSSHISAPCTRSTATPASRTAAATSRSSGHRASSTSLLGHRQRHQSLSAAQLLQRRFIVNISTCSGSRCGQAPTARPSSRCGFHRALRRSTGRQASVKVTCVHPGSIKTAVALRHRGRQQSADVREFFDRRLGAAFAGGGRQGSSSTGHKGQARVVVGWNRPSARAHHGLVVSAAGCRQRLVLPWAKWAHRVLERDTTMKTTGVLFEAGKPFELMGSFSTGRVRAGVGQCTAAGRSAIPTCTSHRW